MTLEETFEKVDEVMEKLSDDSLPLEESFTVYKEGMELLDKCKNIIEDIEKKVEGSESENEE
ncbi:MAG: exodeoxyribonuclease VII small subunit [Lachnospiraceae bacterium]|nr:exodeoxyribonuclease VII small subunit [Lachnospiraceae bacterium]MBR2530301.1 exodeoxyribonuclease VII small subunit [Lachnospiraceae bacterium]